jgi:hypothetical protein
LILLSFKERKKGSNFPVRKEKKCLPVVVRRKEGGDYSREGRVSHKLVNLYVLWLIVHYLYPVLSAERERENLKKKMTKNVSTVFGSCL